MAFEEMEAGAEALSEMKRWPGQAENLLKEKYGEEFCVFLMGGSYGNMGNDTYKVLCVPETDAACRFVAEVRKDGSGFQDGYLETRVCKEMEKVISEKLDEVCGEYYLRIEAGSKYTGNAHKKLTLGEFLALNPKNRFAIYLGTDSESGDGDAETVLFALQEGLDGLEAVNGSVRMSFLPGERVRELEEYMSSRAIVDAGMISILERGQQVQRMISGGKIG